MGEAPRKYSLRAEPLESLQKAHLLDDRARQIADLAGVNETIHMLLMEEINKALRATHDEAMQECWDELNECIKHLPRDAYCQRNGMVLAANQIMALKQTSRG